MAATRIGFIGFGEVGSTFSKTMAENGAEVFVYDALIETEDGEKEIQRRVHADGISILPLEDVFARGEYILSTVTTQVAKEVAQTCAPNLSKGKIFVDLNSTAPSIKVEIAQIIEPTGGEFIEGAILGAVGATGAKTKVLIAGRNGENVVKTLNALGLNTLFYSKDIGKPSAFKMIRSVFSKGLEALMLEMMIAGRRAGIETDLWEDVVDFLNQNPFDRVASNWIQTHAVAYERRFHEMVQVVETLHGLELDPIMTAATKAFFERSFSLGLEDEFPKKPESMGDVLGFFDKKLGNYP